MLVDDDAPRARIALGTLVLQPMTDLGMHVSQVKEVWTFDPIQDKYHYILCESYFFISYLPFKILIPPKGTGCCWRVSYSATEQLHVHHKQAIL